MSQLRSEEISGPEQRSSQTKTDASVETSTNKPKQVEIEDSREVLCSSSSSPTSSTSSSEAIACSGVGGSNTEDTDEVSSSSSSSSRYNVSSSGGDLSTSQDNSSSWKSVTIGSEGLRTDISISGNSTISSGSEQETSDPVLGADTHAANNLASEQDQYSTDGFETDETDGESGLTVGTISKVPTHNKDPTGTTSSKERKAKGLVIHSPSYYSRFQGNRRNNSSSNHEQRREIFAGRERNLRRLAAENQSPGILRRLDNFLYRMSVKVARYHKELCIVFLVCASGLASLRSSPPKIRAVSTPSPFFEDKDASYFINDNYMGEYVDLANKQIPYHPSFLFYYAPWDSESVASKPVFLNVAKHFFFAYHGRVKFYAINCWWPGGQCRKNYKNLSHYPIFVAHIGKSAGIIYNGPIREEPMIKFINSLLKPLTRIDTEEELWHFRAQHDVIMLGYFNFTMEEASDAYETYLQMALRTFEADPFNQVGFGLFLRPELAEKFFLTSSNAISLVLFNEIHTAKWHGGYHTQGLKGPVSQVADWIVERTKTVPLTWVYALRNGFANRPVALGPQDFAQQLSKGPVFLLVTRRYFPSGHSPFYMQMKEIALDYFNCNRSGNVTKLRRTSHKVNSEWASIWSSVLQICQNKGSFECQRLMPNIKHWEKKRILFKREPLSRYENVSVALNFTGLSCISDRQLKFLAIDPVDVPYFIKLGLTGLRSVDRNTDDLDIDPMAFIIDSQNDLILPLPSLNITEIAIAIQNYTTSIESGDTDSLPSQYFWSRNEAIHKENNVQLQSQRQQSTLKSWTTVDLVNHVNGSSDGGDSVLLLYTASFCGFCAIAVTHFVALSRFLADNYGNGNLKVTLARIDMFKNSLPTELNPEELPTVVFLPSWNRSDVRMYPDNQEITPLGLLRFVLSELDPESRVKASLMTPSCGQTTGSCTASKSQTTESDCEMSTTLASIWNKSNSTDEERLSCIKSGRTSVSSQIELLLQRLQNGEEAAFDQGDYTLNRMTTQYWNGQILDRLRTMAVTLEVS